jgi:hypothetical protein
MTLHIINSYKSVDGIDEKSIKLCSDATSKENICQKCMKAQILIVFLTINLAAIAQKNCQLSRPAFIPLNDLGTNIFRGHQGGLYPSGSNSPSGTYLQDLQSYTQDIKPLDSSGNYNSKGQVVFIGVGASNPRTEFQAFQSILDTFQNLSTSLRTVNTCIGGQGVQKMNQLGDNYWKQADKMIDSMGLSNLQVQVAWVETENTGSPDSTFPGGPQLLLKDLKQLLKVMKQKYPKLKLCYFSARTYSGWVEGGSGRGLEYPRDYYNGWAIKWFIDSAISQSQSGFDYKGTTPTIPMPIYSTYNWTNGEVARKDGFSMDCETDFGGDGLHLSAVGENKIGRELFNFFSRDDNTKQWFLQSNKTSIEGNTVNELLVYPNPGNGLININTNFFKETEVVVYNALMEKVANVSITQNTTSIDLTQYPDGFYLIRVRSSNGNYSLKYLKGH